jgi:hypothetical protein
VRHIGESEVSQLYVVIVVQQQILQQKISNKCKSSNRSASIHTLELYCIDAVAVTVTSIEGETFQFTA